MNVFIIKYRPFKCGPNIKPSERIVLAKTIHAAKYIFKKVLGIKKVQIVC